MKRYFLITDINGKEYQIPFDKAYSDILIIPLDLRADNPKFREYCIMICQAGFCPEIIDPAQTKNHMRWIAPSQIKSVSVVIEKPEMKTQTLDQ
jgi:hypothetical protein